MALGPTGPFALQDAMLFIDPKRSRWPCCFLLQLRHLGRQTIMAVVAILHLFFKLGQLLLQLLERARLPQNNLEMRLL
jgi:hypothetical protein